MASVSTYLNFPGNTEEAFHFYEAVFGTKIANLSRMGDIPATEGQPPILDDQKDFIINIQLPILGNHMLMGTDVTSSMGRGELVTGNNVHIMLNPDTRTDTDKLFTALSDGGQVSMELQEMFWGDYYGSVTDKYGIGWMLNCTSKA